MIFKSFQQADVFMNLKERYIIFVVAGCIFLYTGIRFHQQNEEISIAMQSFEEVLVDFQDTRRKAVALVRVAKF